MHHEEFPTDRPAVVTVGLPYANGDLHVGHLRGYIAGDTYARALRRMGQQTAFVCGSDMHGTPIVVNAAEEGVDPEAFALEYHEQYAETFPRFNVEFDNYGHTHDATNTELTTSFVRSWIDQDHVYEKTVEVGYDPEADQWLPDRFVEGTCPYCGDHARGDECDEGCQRHLEPGEIEEPTSTITGNPAQYRERDHRFLRLEDFQTYLQGFLDRLEGTENARNQPREWIEGDLEDLCITRDLDWGIEFPGDDEEELVLYVWVDAPIEYVASTKQYADRVGRDTYDWEQVWKVGGEPEHGTEWDEEWQEETGEIVHVIGRDIIQHHAVFWPAMLRGAGFNEPRAIMATGFVGIEGKALSTSRNRAVWAEEYLDTGFHPDLFRYYIVTGSGLESDVDFSWDRFAERVNGELVGTLGNFLYRSLLFGHRTYGGRPDRAVSEPVTERIEAALADFETAVNEYDLRSIGAVAVDLARFGNEYIQRNEPWNLVDDSPEQARRVIRDCVQLAKAAAVLLQPITPVKAERLWGQLEEPGSVADVPLEAALEAPPASFGEPDELFQQVEDDQVEALTEQLESRVEAAAGDSDEPAGDLEPVRADRVAIDEFEKLDIRVGEIRDARAVPDADELVRLTVDIGVDTRQVVAGLAELHDVEALPGTRVVLLANMEPIELFGVESNGMLLAAGDEADLLTTLGDAELGARIR